MTSPPASASSSVAIGPGSRVEKSRTTIPSRGCIELISAGLPCCRNRGAARGRMGRSSVPGGSCCDKTPADQLTVDLVGAFPDLGDFCVAHQALDAKIAAVTVAAVHLHRLRGDSHRKVGGAQLEHGGFQAELAGAAVDQRGDVIEPSL